MTIFLTRLYLSQIYNWKSKYFNKAEAYADQANWWLLLVLRV